MMDKMSGIHVGSLQTLYKLLEVFELLNGYMIDIESRKV